MQRVESIAALRLILDKARDAGKTIGFVPTMGALHTGHLELVQQAVSENDTVVCSIFVNPAQFNDPKDLVNYPRTLDTDAKALTTKGCQFLFAPTVQEMYPHGPELFPHDFGAIETVLEGHHRPGHFKGMALVVDKLFGIVNPNRAYFGEKDFQQLAIVTLLAAKLHPNIRIVPCPTVREEDGLAMSSRNQLLTAKERAEAPALYKSMLYFKEHMGSMTPVELQAKCVADLNARSTITVQYFEIVNSLSMQSVQTWQDPGPWRLCLAALVTDGSSDSRKVRLIDNLLLKP